jgi:hypothetical protein
VTYVSPAKGGTKRDADAEYLAGRGQRLNRLAIVGNLAGHIHWPV